MPRITPKENQVAAPRRVESTLLVVTPFKANGVQYLAGDLAPIAHRAVRQAAFADPSMFVMEFETAPVDLEWLGGLAEQYEAEYQAEVRRREQVKESREQALRDELKEQERADPRDLERRFKRQEKERDERRKNAREAKERQEIEAELASGRQHILTGFHTD